MFIFWFLAFACFVGAYADLFMSPMTATNVILGVLNLVVGIWALVLAYKIR